jgi:hypothetical protein
MSSGVENEKSLLLSNERPVQAILLLIIFCVCAGGMSFGSHTSRRPRCAHSSSGHSQVMADPRGIFETPWAVYSYYPMNVDLLYLIIPLAFGNDVIPPIFIFTWLSRSATAFLIDLYLNRRSGRTAGLLGAAMFVSTAGGSPNFSPRWPMSIWGWFSLRRQVFLPWPSGWNRIYEKNGWLLASAVAMAWRSAPSSNALLAWFFLTLAVVFLHARDREGRRSRLRGGVLFFWHFPCAFCAVADQESILTGNPIYPLFKGIFGGYGAERQGTYSMVSRTGLHGDVQGKRDAYGESIWEILLDSGRRFFLQGQDHSPRYFDAC